VHDECERQENQHRSLAAVSAAVPHDPDGTIASGNHINRCAYRLRRKIFLRAPVRSVSTLAGIERSDAINGSAPKTPNSNSTLSDVVRREFIGAPLVAAATRSEDPRERYQTQRTAQHATTDPLGCAELFRMQPKRQIIG